MTMDGDDDTEIAAGIRRRVDRLRAVVPARPSSALRGPTDHPSGQVRLKARSVGWSVPVAVLVGVVLAAVALRSGLPSSNGLGRATALHEIVRVKLPGPIYDLAFDPPRDSLWFAYMSGNSPDALYRYDIGSGQLSNWPLPPTDHNGFLERVVIAPDGAVWVTEDYSVVRFDPSTSKMAAFTFAEADPDATPTALTSSPSPGTWPSAIAFDSMGNALVSRHNVTSLIRLDSTPTVIGRLALPAGMAGPGDLVDVGGVIYAAPYAGHGDLEIFDEYGASIRNVAPGCVRLAIQSTQVLCIGSGLVAVSPTASVVQLSPAEGSPANRISPIRDGVAVYLDGPGVIQEVSPAGSVLAQYATANVPLTVNNPKGIPETVYSRVDVSAIAGDAHGTIWYADVTDSALVGMQP